MVNPNTGVSDNPSAILFFSVRNKLEDRYCQPMSFTGSRAVVLADAAFRQTLKHIDKAYEEEASLVPLRSSDLSLWIVGEMDPFTGIVSPVVPPIDVSLLGFERY